MKEVEKALRGDDLKRFQAAADVVLHTNNLAKQTEANDGEIPTSAACVLQ